MSALGATPFTERAKILPLQSWPLTLQGIAPVIWVPPLRLVQIESS